MKYERFKEVWDGLIEDQFKQAMLDYENSNEPDTQFTDITLENVSSCADEKTPNFWASVNVSLDVKQYDDTDALPTKYYILTTSDRVSLQHDFMEDDFTTIWNTPSYVEKELIKALLADIVEEYEMCFETFAKETFSILFSQQYLSISQFSEEARMRYFELFDEASLLTSEVRDMFLF